ncbi:MAG TPA: hypothetical protein VHZ96_01535, partial [Frankiaceae bacterium]|nr:hypothetical protein [Frankiaceae bacterium]
MADGDYPAALVDFVVVVQAEQVKVFGFGFALMFQPVLAVVGFCPGRWPITAGPDAAAVAGYQETAEAG